MVYKAFREVCDQEEQQQEQPQPQQQQLQRHARRIKDEGNNSKKRRKEVDCAAMPASRLLHDEVCKTTTVEDCVTKYKSVKKRVCGDKVLSRRIGVVYASSDNDDNGHPSEPEAAFKVIYEGGKRLSEHFADEAREKIDRDDDDEDDCRTVVETKEEVRMEERCNTQEEERCQVHQEERCRIV